MASEAQDSNDVPEQQHNRLRILDTMTTWPWTRSINPLEDEVTTESIAWVTQFPYFTHRAWNYTDVLLKVGCGAEGIKSLCYLY